jgi:hypothetical protein
LPPCRLKACWRALTARAQALEGLQGLACVCKLHGSGTHRCHDKKDHQFIAMEVRPCREAPRDVAPLRCD